MYFPVRSFASSLVSSASYLVYSGGAILVIELNRSFMLDRWIFDQVYYSRANRRVSYALYLRVFRACLATEPSRFVLLCPGIHCIVICRLNSLSLNMRRSRPWNAIVDIVRPIATVQVGFRCPFVDFLAALVISQR